MRTLHKYLRIAKHIVLIKYSIPMFSMAKKNPTCHAIMDRRVAKREIGEDSPNVQSK